MLLLSCTGVILTFWFIFLLGINYLLLQVLLYKKFLTSFGLHFYRFLRKPCEIFYIFSKLYLGLFQWAPEQVNIKRPSSPLPRGFVYYNKTVFSLSMALYNDLMNVIKDESLVALSCHHTYPKLYIMWF